MNFIVKIHSNNDECETPRKLSDLVALVAKDIRTRCRRLPQMDRSAIHTLKLPGDGCDSGTYRIIPIDYTWKSYAWLDAETFDVAERAVSDETLSDKERLELALKVCQQVKERRWFG